MVSPAVALVMIGNRLRMNDTATTPPKPLPNHMIRHRRDGHDRHGLQEDRVGIDAALDDRDCEKTSPSAVPPDQAQTRIRTGAAPPVSRDADRQVAGMFARPSRARGRARAPGRPARPKGAVATCQATTT